ncbi:MAG: exodeoxyribonuclease III, partial [Curtobacterium sp.]
MQEIKCKPEQFPTEAFEAAGYQVEAHGLNQWNGVAFASRLPMEDVTRDFPGQPGFLKGHEGPDLPVEARAIGVTVDGVRLWSLYVPNGRELGDPHYAYKLDWLAQLADRTSEWLTEDPQLPLALMGDWNVAPLDQDVWDMAVFEGATHVSEPRSGRSRSGGCKTSCARSSRTATPTGTTSSSASPGTRACASTSSSARRPSRTS